ncbi:MAG: hypothetical protein WAX89_08165 [Alphaproteobacteria bacterium]
MPQSKTGRAMRGLVQAGVGQLNGVSQPSERNLIDAAQYAMDQNPRWQQEAGLTRAELARDIARQKGVLGNGRFTMTIRHAT